MKKILLLILLFFGLKSFGQYPINQNLGADSTLVTSKGGLKGRIIVYAYTDTTAANNDRIRQYAGALIFCTNNNTVYYRNATANRWLEFSSGSTGITALTNGLTTIGSTGYWGGLLTQNTNIDGNALYNLTIGNLTNFKVGTTGALLSYAIADSIRTTGLGLTNDTTFKIKIINPATGAEAYSNWIGAGTPITLKTLGVTQATYSSSTGVLNIPKDQRVGLYLNLGKTSTRVKPVIFGNTLLFTGNSWANGDFSLGTPWSTQLTSYYGKTKVSVYANGYELNYLVNANWTNSRSCGVDSIAFVDIAMLGIVNSASSGLPYVGTYYFGESTPNNSKTYKYINGTYRAYIANYYLDADWFSVASLADANFRDAVSSDSLGTKSTSGSIGLGAFSFTKPAGKTSLVIGTYGADSIRVRQGTITVSLAGNIIYTRYFNGLNNSNMGLTATIKKGLNYEAIVLQNLPDSAATVTVTCSGDSTRFDYVGYLLPKEKAIRPIFINNVGYGSAPNFFTFSYTVIDTANQMLQNAVTDFQDYPVFIQNTNNWFDSTSSVQQSTFHFTAAGNDSVAKAYIANLLPQVNVPVMNAAWTSSNNNANYTLGYVGVGTTIPTHQLTVNGQVRVNNMNSASIFDSVVVINDGVLEKRLASSIIGATPTLQQVLTAGSTGITDHTISGAASSDLAFSGFTTFGISVLDQLDLVADNALTITSPATTVFGALDVVGAALSADGSVFFTGLTSGIIDTTNYKPRARNITSGQEVQMNSWAQVGARGGTVTSVATGLGLSGGTITTSGTIIADTSYLVNKSTAQVISGVKNFTGAPLFPNGFSFSNTVTATGEVNINGNNNINIKSEYETKIGDIDGGMYINVSGGLADGVIYLLSTAGTGTRVPVVSSTGAITGLANSTDGFVLTLVSGAPAWAAGGGSTTWNGIAAPTGDLTLTFGAGESTTFTDQNTTEDHWTVNNATATTNSIYSINRTSTALAAGNNIMELISSGVNGTNAITSTGLRVSVTNTNATSGTNTALDLTGSGAATFNNAIVASGDILITPGVITNSSGSRLYPLNMAVAKNLLYANIGGIGFSINPENSQAGYDVFLKSSGTEFGLSSYNGAISFYAGGITTASMWIDGTTKFVGIGTVSPDRLLHPEISDATTNTIVYPFRMSHTTSGTAAVGGGVGMEMETENASGTMRITGSITNPMTDATDATEDADLVFNTIDAGTLTESFRIDSDGKPIFRATNTNAGTTGNQTINKASGTVNIAAAGTTVTVTNSLCTTSSIVFAIIRTNDATARVANVVPGSGSFVINIVACTSEVSIGFLVIN